LRGSTLIAFMKKAAFFLYKIPERKAVSPSPWNTCLSALGKLSVNP
jgi:hypothetical protein